MVRTIRIICWRSGFMDDIKEISPKILSRNQFDSTTNWAIREAIEYLTMQKDSKVTIELVK
jgi:hypothetical protein